MRTLARWPLLFLVLVPACGGDKTAEPPAPAAGKSAQGAATPVQPKSAAPRAGDDQAASTTGSADAQIVPWSDVDEASVLADPQGQWAVSAEASSQYGNDRYDPAQACGAPDVAAYADDPKAWCPTGLRGNIDWIELGYERPVHATGVRIRQSHLPGTVVRITGLEPDGSEHVLWAGEDSNAYPADTIAWLAVRWPATAFQVQRVRVELDFAKVKGWKQIDAVQLVGD